MTSKMEWNRFTLDFDKGPCIMGILNATPDSFSDGGKYLGLEQAVAHGLELVKAGAGILDIGGESSRPFAEPVPADQEMERVIPVIERLSKQIDVPISIDTFKSEVAREAIKAGAAIINDISAMETDPAMAEVARETGVPIILMHMKGTPETMQIKPSYDDLIKEIADHLTARIEVALSAGIQRDRIILDPGIGFGKTVTHNLMLIKHLDQIKALGYPVLMGPSRKSFIQKILSDAAGKPIKADDLEAEQGTMAAAAACLMNGAEIVRVHDVASFAPMARITAAIMNA